MPSCAAAHAGYSRIAIRGSAPALFVGVTELRTCTEPHHDAFSVAADAIKYFATDLYRVRWEMFHKPAECPGADSGPFGRTTLDN